MNKIIEEMRELEKQLAYHARKYYVEDCPEISDFEYDEMFYKLVSLEQQYPEFASPSSPTTRVGGAVLDKFEKINHNVFMGSLRDVFNYDELNDFLIKTPCDGFSVECKIDGLSVSLIYDNGELVTGSTRGDGRVGEDVTENLKTIHSIPLKIDYKGHLEVRGEVFMPRKSFISLNQKREQSGEQLFKNPRNAAAGALRQLDSKITAQRKLDIFIFNVQECDISFKTHKQGLLFLKDLGFNIIPYLNVLNTYDEIIQKIETIGKLRDTLPFDIDGVVIKVNNISSREQYGDTGTVPKWAVAYKFPPEEKETVLREICVNVGRTGVITPYAVFDTVQLAGTSVSKATLHNHDFITERDIRIGDTVVVRKAGDIIPEIIKVNKDKRPASAVPYEMPKYCPSCGEPIYREKETVAYYCTNSSCPQQLLRNLSHFVSRDAMNIDGLGSAQLEAMVDLQLLKDAADLYYLKKEQLLVLGKNVEILAGNIVKSITASKNAGLERLLYALGIRQVGEKAAKALAIHFKSIDAFFELTVEQLCEVDDIGEITANNIINYFLHPQTRNLIEKLRLANVKMTYESEIIDTRFEGFTFVLSGTLPTMKRNEASELIEKYGGKTSGSVSKKTTYLLSGEEPGSKLIKAKELGIKIIDEKEFLKMLE